MIMDPNVIQIRDEFFLCKRQYELTPELLSGLSVCSLFHHLINIRTLSQLDDWLKEIADSPCHYENDAMANVGVYGNVMGEVERIALELSDEQKQAAAREFEKLGSVDLRVIDYATSKFGKIVEEYVDYYPEVVGLKLRTAVADLLSAEDVQTFNTSLDAVKSVSLPGEIRDYVDFVRTLNDKEREALLINNDLCGGSDEDVADLISTLRDGYNYCQNIVMEAMSHCDYDKHLSITPRNLTFRTKSDDGCYEDEHKVAVLFFDVNRGDAWLSNGKHLDIAEEANRYEDDGEPTEFMRQALLAVGDYLATTRHEMRLNDDDVEDSLEVPLIAEYKWKKRDHVNDLLLLQQGGYYEALGDDAVNAATLLRHNLWLRNTGCGGKTAAIILTDAELTELRKHSNRVYVDSTIKELDDENLQLEPTVLNVLLDFPPELPIVATIFSKPDHRLAVRGTIGSIHFPPKDLSRVEENYYHFINGKVEEQAAAKALLLMKNMAEIKKSLDVTYKN